MSDESKHQADGLNMDQLRKDLQEGKYSVKLADELMLDGADFEEELVSRGIIAPPAPSRLQRTFAAVKRALKRASGWVVWHFWEKRRYQRRIDQGIARWKKLAGLDRGLAVQPYDPFLDTVYKPDAVAYAEHEHIIKTKIVKEQLPRPDSDDRGLN